MGKTYTVRCSELNKNLNGVFTFNNSKFEVPLVLPKEKLEVSLLYGKDKGKAKLEKVVEASPLRVNPVCPAYETCGGCKLMHTTYENQLSIKTNMVKDLLGRFGEVLPCEGMDDPYHYRNKIHATLSKTRKGKIVSGLYEETSHRVVPVSACAIEHENAAKVMKTIRDYMEKYNVEPYNEDNGRGVIRHVLFRTAKSGDTLVVIVCGAAMFKEKGKLSNLLVSAHPFIKSVVLNYNSGKTSMVLGKKEEVLYGPGYITDEMCGISFRISAHSFYQVNTIQAEKLYTEAITKAKLSKTDTILDAYSGIGTIASVCAKLTGASKVTGVELNHSAVMDAKESAKLNGLNNLEFIEADATEYLDNASKNNIKYDCIILDPPRSGTTEAFIKAMSRMKPKTIIYISCNPQTLERDLKLIVRDGYKASFIKPFDMFPQTGHCEACVVLTKPSR